VSSSPELRLSRIATGNYEHVVETRDSGSVFTHKYRGSRMNPSALLQKTILAGALVLSSCAQDHTVPFDAAAFTRYSGTGTGVVTGTASLTNAYNQVVTAGDSSASVQLMPVNAYTDEIVAKSYKVIGKMASPQVFPIRSGNANRPRRTLHVHSCAARRLLCQFRVVVDGSEHDRQYLPRPLDLQENLGGKRADRPRGTLG